MDISTRIFFPRMSLAIFHEHLGTQTCVDEVLSGSFTYVGAREFVVRTGNHLSLCAVVPDETSGAHLRYVAVRYASTRDSVD